ncbi:MAG TPA: glycine oxidase ThiO [Pyrinomonadaceae bacterium]|nr:glycine oxidase ThiO [Pyrinomonadaceae bacterium]
MSILIIGAGVIGLSIARELHRRGAGPITIIDAGHERIGGASWAAAGMLGPHAENVTAGVFYDDCCKSNELYTTFAEDLQEETGIDIELDRCGSTFLAFSDSEAAELEGRHHQMLALGARCTVLQQHELQVREPLISLHAVLGLHFPDEGCVDNRRLMTALRRYAEINKIAIVNEVAEEVTYVNGETRVRAADGSAHSAQHTILATGAWSSLIKIRGLHGNVPVKPIRGQMISWAGARVLHHIVYSSRGYLVPRRGGRVLAGATVEDVGFDSNLSPTAAKELSDAAAEMFPCLGEVEIDDHWAGLRPCSPDAMPIIGAIDGFPGLWVATAHFRNGILLAPNTAELIADAVLLGRDDLPAAYSPKRFFGAAMNA